MEFSERLAEIIAEKGISNYKIAKEAHVAKTTVANYLSGKTKPNQNTLKQLCEYLEVNQEWLMDGSGPKILIKEFSLGYDKLPTVNNPEVKEELRGVIDKMGNICKIYENQIDHLKKECNRLGKESKTK